MKVYFESRLQSRAIGRIIDAFYWIKHPKINPVADPQDADLVVFYAIGRLHHLMRAAEELLRQGKQYAIVQCSLRSTRNPNTADWIPLWDHATAIWSYFDLYKKADEDGVKLDFDFYHAPLGGDFRIFYPPQYLSRKYTLLTIGDDPKAECLNECWDAVESLLGKVAHVGTGTRISRSIDYFPNVNDRELARLYHQSYSVSALRRKGGFELPAVEAALCGVKPILFDQPDFTHWFKDLAWFIPEDEHIRSNLVTIFLNSVIALRLSKDEAIEAQQRFDWRRLVTEFWERLL